VLSSMSKCADITRNSEMRRNTYAAGLMYDLLSRNNFPNIYIKMALLGTVSASFFVLGFGGNVRINELGMLRNLQGELLAVRRVWSRAHSYFSILPCSRTCLYKLCYLFEPFGVYFRGKFSTSGNKSYRYTIYSLKNYRRS
jgi:hypothetical protein